MSKFELSKTVGVVGEELEAAKQRLLDLRSRFGDRSEAYLAALKDFRGRIAAVFGKKDICAEEELVKPVVAEDTVVADDTVVAEELVNPVVAEFDDDFHDDFELLDIPIPKVFYKNLFFDLNGVEVFCDSDLVLGERLCFVDRAGNRVFSDGVVERIESFGDISEAFYLVRMSCGLEFRLSVDTGFGGTVGV